MRILHTMLRVGDLDRSIKFYQDILGMRLHWLCGFYQLFLNKEQG